MTLTLKLGAATPVDLESWEEWYESHRHTASDLSATQPTESTEEREKRERQKWDQLIRWHRAMWQSLPADLGSVVDSKSVPSASFAEMFRGLLESPALGLLLVESNVPVFWKAVLTEIPITELATMLESIHRQNSALPVDASLFNLLQVAPLKEFLGLFASNPALHLPLARVFGKHLRPELSGELLAPLQSLAQKEIDSSAQLPLNDPWHWLWLGLFKGSHERAIDWLEEIATSLPQQAAIRLWSMGMRATGLGPLHRRCLAK